MMWLHPQIALFHFLSPAIGGDFLFSELEDKFYRGMEEEVALVALSRSMRAVLFLSMRL